MHKSPSSFKVLFVTCKTLHMHPPWKSICHPWMLYHLVHILGIWDIMLVNIFKLCFFTCRLFQIFIKKSFEESNVIIIKHQNMIKNCHLPYCNPSFELDKPKARAKTKVKGMSTFQTHSQGENKMQERSSQHFQMHSHFGGYKSQGLLKFWIKVQKPCLH